MTEHESSLHVTVGKTPEYLKSMLQLNFDVHFRNTRFGKLNLRCPIYNNFTEGGRSFSVRSIKDRNNLSKGLIIAKDTKSFEERLINTLSERERK